MTSETTGNNINKKKKNYKNQGYSHIPSNKLLTSKKPVIQI